jgi:ribose-phosphate pyrophosphokinase
VSRKDLQLFALSESRVLGEAVARVLGTELAELEERQFEDGEHKARPLESVRDRDVYVLQSLNGEAGRSANDKLCRLLFLAATLKQNAAARVTVLAPYLCYSRKDRQTKSRDPVTTRYVAALLEASGVDRVATLDVHNPAAFQNAYRCGTEHLSAQGLFAEHFAKRLAGEQVVVMSPDVGGAKRAEAFRRVLQERLNTEVGNAFMEKHRSGGEVTGQAVVGEVENRRVLLIDDLISTGGTLARAARACRQRGARSVEAAATHGLFTQGGEPLREPALSRIVTTNSVTGTSLAEDLRRDKLEVLDVAPVLAEAIRRMHG